MFFIIDLLCHVIIPDTLVKGCYAISVSGDLPEDVTDDLRDRGVAYQSRDTSER